MILGLIITISILGYIASGVLAHGLNFAYYQRRWPRVANYYLCADFRDGVFVGLLGPLGLTFTILHLFIRGEFFRHGLMFFPKQEKEKNKDNA